jgi:ATP phosphoribosyltransferase regulatory subunit
MQCGVELLGAAGLQADLEILACAADALRACDAPRFRIELGHAAIFTCLADQLDVKDDLREQLVSAIATKNFPTLKELLMPFGSKSAAQALLSLPKLFGGEEVLARAESLFKDVKAKQALNYLKKLYEQLKALNLHECIDIDLGLVRGQGFYTGLEFRGYVEGSGKPVLSGGRYDDLLAEFGRPAAAVGFVVMLDPLAEALLVEGKCPAAPAIEALIFADTGREAEAVRRAAELRGEGKACLIATCDTLEEAQTFAQGRGIPEVIVA